MLQWAGHYQFDATDSPENDFTASSSLVKIQKSLQKTDSSAYPNLHD